MGLSYAVERLYGLGWNPPEGRLVKRLDDGRAYPATIDIQREFSRAGMTLAVHYISMFECYRAEWRNISGEVLGHVIGGSEAEAVVFAYVQILEARLRAGT